MRRTFLPSLCAFLLLLTGCTVGPNYKRPVVNVPGTYRGGDETRSQAPDATSLGDEKWWTVFQDEQLQKLVRTALKQNFDVRIAATRVLEAQEQLIITRSNQFPFVRGPGHQRRPPVDHTRLPQRLFLSRGPDRALRLLERRFLGPLSPRNRSLPR